MSDLSDERKERISDNRLTCLLEGGFRTGILETMRKDEQIAALEDLIDARAELARVKGERDAAVANIPDVAKTRDGVVFHQGQTLYWCWSDGCDPHEYVVEVRAVTADGGWNHPWDCYSTKESALAARAPARGDAGAGREGNQ